MDEKNYDEMYYVLDELNARIEEIVNEFEDPEIRDIVIAKIQEKASEFIYNLEEEVEKLDSLELVA